MSEFFNTEDKDLAFDNVVGSPMYVARDVLNGDYDWRCDVWSLGVVMFVILTGEAPFSDPASKKGVLGKILNGNWDRTILDTNRISAAAEEIIESIFVVDPNERITIDEILSSEWFEMARDEILEEGRDLLNPDVFVRFQEWGTYCKLQKILLRIIAGLFHEELFIKRWEKLFNYIDLDNIGKFFWLKFRISGKESVRENYS